MDFIGMKKTTSFSFVSMLILFVFSCFSASAVAQIRPANDTRNYGSAKELKGVVYGLVVFVETDKCRFPKSSKDDFYRSWYSAQNWLVEQAAKMGQQVVFEGGNFGYDTSVAVSYIPTGIPDNGTLFVDEVFRSVGYEDANGFCRWLANNGYKNGFALIVTNRKDRSYSYHHTKETSSGRDHNSLLETAVICRNGADGSYWPSSLSHEVLHLFGAWDLYADSNYANSAEQQEMAYKMFPNSIMLRVGSSFDVLEVDCITAWLIGWTSKYEDWYPWFQKQ